MNNASVENVVEISRSRVATLARRILAELLGAPLAAGVDRSMDVCGQLGAESRARSWAGLGFTPEEVAAWLAVGIFDPIAALQLRDLFFDADAEGLLDDCDGTTWALAIAHGHRSPVDFARYLESGVVSC